PLQRRPARPYSVREDINKHFVSTYLKGCSMQIDNVDSQPSHEGGVLVLVSGSFTVPDAMKRRFTQSFFLAPQKGGYFVLNDVLRYIPVEPGN
uniref:NTF2 domain-containing protein n=1 Tax=Aegilops tauschii subsp. strangulata TaxID=200361 RepID=A0A453SML3_AEGTS